MASLTIAVDDDLLRRARKRAVDLGMSVNAFLTKQLERFAEPYGSDDGRERVRRLLELARDGHGHSRGWKWNREELYEDRIGSAKRVR